jgi:prophage regulatory protein
MSPALPVKLLVALCGVAMTEQLRILRLREVRERTGRSQSSIYADMAAGKFPPAVPIGGHAVGWVETEIDAWIKARVAERDATLLKKIKDDPKTDADRGAVARELIAKVAREKANW